ncbi:MAG: ATP synthase F0 subunit B [Synechococcales cyanobacterium]
MSDEARLLEQVNAALEELEDMIFSSPSWFGRTLVDENLLGDQISEIQKALPKVIKEAQKVMRQRDEILEEAHQYAQAVIDEANRRAEYLVRDSNIVRQAQAQAAQIIRQSQQEREAVQRQVYDEAERLQREADRYVDETLADLEQRLVASLRVVQNGRQRLQ